MADYITFQPSDHFKTKLHTGTGSAASITGVGFQPDLVWVKERGGTENNVLEDAVRGATKLLQSDSSAAEQTGSQTLTSFDSDGFSVGTDAGWNTSSDTYVMWNWKANGAGSANTDGSINTTATSVNTTAGFSICKWTGNSSNATIGHGLGVVPQTIFVKNLADAESWSVYHHEIGNTHSLFLDTDGGDSSNSKYWNNTSPTSTTFSVGNGGEVNGSGDAMIAYVFAEKHGFSKFGTYTGNESTDGPFIYCGFKPAFVMSKCSSHSSSNWVILDATRDPYNVGRKRLYPNLTSAEDAADRIDFLSNGFKIRGDGSDTNGSTRKYLYWAFAEEPLVASNKDVVTAG